MRAVTLDKCCMKYTSGLRFGTYELRFFTRYVDDILVALKDENTANSFTHPRSTTNMVNMLRAIFFKSQYPCRIFNVHVR